MKLIKYFSHYLFTWKHLIVIFIVFGLQGALFISSYSGETVFHTVITELILKFYGVDRPGIELFSWLLHQLPLYALLGVFIYQQWNHHFIYVFPRVETIYRWLHAFLCISFIFIGIYFFVGFCTTGVSLLGIKKWFLAHDQLLSILPLFAQNPLHMIHIFLLMWLHAFLLFLMYFMIFLLSWNLVIGMISVMGMIYFSVIGLYIDFPWAAYFPTVRSMIKGHEKLHLSFAYSYLFFAFFIVVLYIGIRLILKYNKDIIWKIKNEI